MLSGTHVFSYESINASPKQIPPSLTVEGIYYEALHNNSFMRIHTIPGRVYHLMQAHYYYQLPDWKLHFAIESKDLPTAWNIIGNLFLERKCKTTMKMIVPDYGVESWPNHMHGREITVYIYKHKKYYEQLNWDQAPTIETEQSRDFWLAFAMEAEARLTQNNITARPHPEGDKPLGRYVSLRNEAFIKFLPEWEDRVPANRRVDFNGSIYCYPPNETGHNAAGHKSPLDRIIYAFFSQSLAKKIERNKGKEELRRIQQTIKVS